MWSNLSGTEIDLTKRNSTAPTGIGGSANIGSLRCKSAFTAGFGRMFDGEEKFSSKGRMGETVCLGDAGGVSGNEEV
jgi:hypothetical protein